VGIKLLIFGGCDMQEVICIHELLIGLMPF
jgi:hypothetical protein